MIPVDVNTCCNDRLSLVPFSPGDYASHAEQGGEQRRYSDGASDPAQSLGHCLPGT